MATKIRRFVSICVVHFRLWASTSEKLDMSPDCWARAYLGDLRPKQPALATEVGTQCPGFAMDQGCCEALPMQRVAVWLQHAKNHNQEQLKSFDTLVAGAEDTLAQVRHGLGDVECVPFAEAMIEPRAEAVRRLAERAGADLQMVEHLIWSGVCSHCFPEENGADFRISSQDGSAAAQMSITGALMEATQRNLLLSGEQLLRLDPEHHCVPAYFAGLLSGTDVGDPVDIGSIMNAGDGHVDSSSAAAMGAAVEAIARMRKWPLGRRLISKRLGNEAPAHFDEDFFEIAERLMGFLISTPGRLVHQLQTIALALQVPRSKADAYPVARLLWGASTGDVDAIGFTWTPAPIISSTSVEVDDPGAAFGFVILISNRTAADLVDHLLQLLEGPRTLFIEDVCGNALEALGYGCHVGGPQQGKCLQPSHAARISRATAEMEPGIRPRVAWRRHAATRSIAHSAWELASSYWGDYSTAWIADLRPASACPEAIQLADAIESVPNASMKIVNNPEVLFGLDTTPWPSMDPAESELGTASSRMPESMTDASVPLSTRLAEYVSFHENCVQVLAASRGKNIDVIPEIKMLVYSCQPFGQCGGHGDRMNGMITAFLLAVLTQRMFLVDAESPLPLHMLLEPSKIDWRVRGSIGALAALRQHSYHDKRQQFEADIGRLFSYPDKVLVISKNYRMLRSLFEAPDLRPHAAALGLPLHAPPFLAADLFDLLFRPAPVLQLGLAHLRQSLGNLEDRRFVAIHLRTGDVAWDPARHGKGDLSSFLDCARKAELELEEQAHREARDADPTSATSVSKIDLPWLLATDSLEVAQVAATLPEAQAGKLRVPDALGRIHIDRSEMDAVLRGTAANYAEWLLFGRAVAVVLSRSFFGETAAEIGRVRNTYFAPGGGCVRMDLSSS